MVCFGSVVTSATFAMCVYFCEQRCKDLQPCWFVSVMQAIVASLLQVRIGHICEAV